jgi:hypothetical protein
MWEEIAADECPDDCACDECVEEACNCMWCDFKQGDVVYHRASLVRYVVVSKPDEDGDLMVKSEQGRPVWVDECELYGQADGEDEIELLKMKGIFDEV